MKLSKLKIALFAVGFLACLMVFLYPTISNLWNQHLSNDLIRDFDQTMEDIESPKLTAMWEDALAYNAHLGDEEGLKELGLTYGTVLNPNENGMMGYLEIPKIRVELPIYHSLDETVLQTGIGHMSDTALPVGGESTHCVLAGHTGLASAKLLSNLDQLQKGDLFRLKVLNKTLTYQVVSSVVVLPSDSKHLKVIEGEDLVTLITCTPYGINSHRLLVTGTRVDEDEILKNGSLITGSELVYIDPRILVPVEVLGVSVIGAAVYGIVKLIKRRGKKHEEE